jgi:hypothetical protein
LLGAEEDMIVPTGGTLTFRKSERMEWIESEGGPLILLDEDLLKYWDGAEPPRYGRTVRAESRASGSALATDYDRACDIRRVIGVLEVGPRIGVVFAGEALPTAWWPAPSEQVGLIVRWVYGNSDEAFSAALLRLPDGLFRHPGVQVTLRGKLLLFDAAMPGHAIVSPHLRMSIREGTYRIQTAVYEPDSETSMLLHRFKRVS